MQPSTGKNTVITPVDLIFLSFFFHMKLDNVFYAYNMAWIIYNIKDKTATKMEPYFFYFY